MTVQDTSARAYFGPVLQTLGERQLQVYQALERGGNWTNKELSRELGLEINSITPRIKELRDKGIVREAERRYCKVSGMMAIAWELNV